MKKNVYILFLLFSIQYINANPTQIDTLKFHVLPDVSQTEGNPLKNAFDGDTNTWWDLETRAGNPLPLSIVVEFSDTLNLCGISYLCNITNNSTRLLSYEVYISNDTNSWGKLQAKSDIFWQNDNDIKIKHIEFGEVRARYMKLVYLDNTNTWNNSIQTAELAFFKNDSAKTFKSNQYINIDSISDLVSAQEKYELKATSSSNLPLAYEIISGPATLEIDTVSGEEVSYKYFLNFTELEGDIIISAKQEGDAEYYGIERLFKIKVENPLLYDIELFTPLIEDEDITMPELYEYKLHARAEIGASTFNKITEIEFLIDGEPITDKFYVDYEISEGTAYAFASFSPEKYGSYTVEIRASASNGKTASISRSVIVDSAEDSRVQRTMDKVLINFPTPGRTNGGVYTLPQFIGSYDRIIAHLDVACPDIDGGCDDWDRVAWVEIQTPDGQWREIIRYLTPYGVACDHSLDVTDFAPWLQGEIPIRMFIDTWGTGGWEITLDFEYRKGLPQYLYAEIYPLWDGNFPFGNMNNLQPLDTLNIALGEDIAAASLKITTTGHGWGANNSKNAAEFYRAKHNIKVNDEVIEQDLWMDCNPNPDTCLNQRGTWQHNRAGWCPGIIAPGYNYNISKHMASDNLSLIYAFDETYIDYCHPSNPECVSGKTCSDCYDTYNPQYDIASYLFLYSEKMYDSIIETSNEVYRRQEIEIVTYPNPSRGSFYIKTTSEIGSGLLSIIDITGKIIQNYVFSSSSELNSKEFNLSNYPKGIYFIRVQTRNANTLVKHILQ